MATAASHDGYYFFWGHTPPETGAVGKHILSQWYPCTFLEQGEQGGDARTYTSAEQYMMVKKAELFGDKDSANAIMGTSSPREQKALGRKVSPFDPVAWDGACYNVVVQGNRLKFSQNQEFKDFLLSTGNKLIVEASPQDKIWGIGLSEAEAAMTPAEQWPGTNLLGKALTQVRDELQRTSA